MAVPARVVVDGRALTDSSAFRGIGTYLRNVLAGLASTSGIELAVICTSGAELPEGARRIRTVRAAPGRWRTVEHELLLPLDLARSRADVVLAPAMDAPRRCRSPWVQTLHDTWPLHSERSAADRPAFQRQAARFRDAAAIITVSQWSAEGAVDLLGLDPTRVHVVPHGVSTVFHPGAGPAEPPYVLFVGEYDPRKRHDHAFAAVAGLKAAGLPHRLVVTGRIAPWFAETMRSLVAAAPNPELIDLVGHVSIERLVALYQAADAVLVTSEGEGFGLPALEAMASGVPVVAYDNSATAEVVRGAGVLVSDGDLDAYVMALQTVITDRTWRTALVELGMERAAKFTWEASVAGHAEVLLKVAR